MPALLYYFNAAITPLLNAGITPLLNAGITPLLHAGITPLTPCRHYSFDSMPALLH